MKAFKALRRVGVCGGACVAVGLLMASGVAASQRKCRVVGAGGSFGTLQATVDAASAGDTLKVKGTCYGETTVSKDLTIVGHSNPGFGPATLNGGGKAQSPSSVVTVNAGVTVAIKGLTITGGEASFGGGIFNGGALTLTNSIVTGNAANQPAFGSEPPGGGGIFNERGSLTLDHSTVTDNRAPKLRNGEELIGSLGGGGIYNESGSLTLNDSTVSDNNGAGYGGGIKNLGGQVWVTNSILSGNEAPRQGFFLLGESWGGGIYNYDGQVSFSNSTVADNEAGSGGGGGGGIYNEGGSLTLTASTVTGNKGEGGNGAGIQNAGGDSSVTLNNSAVTDNKARTIGPARSGGGISNFGSLTLNNSAVSGNTVEVGDSGGIDNGGGGELTLNNSDVTGNTADGGGDPGLGLCGGIGNNASLILSGSSSVTQNTASVEGGGICNDKTAGATLTYGIGWTGTVSGNTPDDIFNF